MEIASPSLRTSFPGDPASGRLARTGARESTAVSRAGLLTLETTVPARDVEVWVMETVV